MIDKILLGLFVGVLCGMVPLVFGLLTKHKMLAIAGVAVTSLSGVLFSALNKSPFTAIGIGVLFAVIIFGSIKRKSRDEENDEDDFFTNDNE